MVIIFHCKKINVLAFFCLIIYLKLNHKGEYNFYFEQAIKISRKNNFQKMANGLLLYYGQDNTGNHIYILERDGSKKIIENSIKDFWNLLFSNSNYYLFDLSSYSNIFIKIGYILDALKLYRWSDRFNLKGCHQIYGILKKDIRSFKNKL